MSPGTVQRDDMLHDPALARLDEELVSYARDASPEVPPGFVDRMVGAAFDGRAAEAPREFMASLAAGSLREVVRSFRETSRAAFGAYRVPFLVRLQAMGLVALVSLVLGATVALAALGAVEIIRVAQHVEQQRPVSAPVPTRLGPSPDGAAIGGESEASPDGTLPPRPTAPPGTPAATPGPSAAPSAVAGATPRPGSTPGAAPGGTATPPPAGVSTAAPRVTLPPLPTRKPRVTLPPLPTAKPRVTLPPLPTATPKVTLPPEPTRRPRPPLPSVPPVPSLPPVASLPPVGSAPPLPKVPPLPSVPPVPSIPPR